MPAGAWLACTETVVVVLVGGAVGSVTDAAAAPAAAAPKTLSWNLAWAFFFLRRAHQKYPPTGSRTPARAPRDIGSENSPSRPGPGAAVFSAGFRVGLGVLGAG